MPDPHAAAQGKQETPWGMGFTSPGDLFDEAGPILVTRPARPGEVFDPEAFAAMEGEPIIALTLPDGAQRTLILAGAQIAEDGRAVTLTLHAREAPGPAEAPAREIPERERLIHDDPALAASIRDGIAEAEAGRTVYLGSFAEYLDGDDD